MSGVLLGSVILARLASSLAWAGPDNIAPQAKVTASSQYSDGYAARNVNDGVVCIQDQGEWACQGQTTWWGLIRYPWIKLTWPTEQTVDRVVLYDRPCAAEHTAGGILEFSDGSLIQVFALPNNGSPKQVRFAPKRIAWLRFKVTDGLGVNLGLSEMEVFLHSPDASDYAAWVDPYIETCRGRWFFCTPGSRPFGMVVVAPYTRNKNQWGGGYNYNSTEILGFSQIHAWIMSGINLMPITSTVDPTGGEQAWKSAFSHASEIIQPGYQRVYLDRYRTWVEMTCTERVSLYRLTYTQDALAHVLLSLGGWIGSVSMVEAWVNQVTDHRLEGSVGITDRLWGGPQLTRIFFFVEFDRPWDALDGWQGQSRLKDISELAMPQATRERLSNNRKYLFRSLPEEAASVSAAHAVRAGDRLQVKIAVSDTGLDNARHNLQAECPHWDFDRVRAQARAQWNRWLGRIQVQGGTHAQRVKFYTDPLSGRGWVEANAWQGTWSVSHGIRELAALMGGSDRLAAKGWGWGRIWITAVK